MTAPLAQVRLKRPSGIPGRNVCVCSHPMKPSHITKKAVPVAPGSTIMVEKDVVGACQEKDCFFQCPGFTWDDITLRYVPALPVEPEEKEKKTRKLAPVPDDMLYQTGILKPCGRKDDWKGASAAGETICPDCGGAMSSLKGVIGFKVCDSCGLLGATDDGKQLVGMVYHAWRKPGQSEFSAIRWHKKGDKCDKCPMDPKWGVK